MKYELFMPRRATKGSAGYDLRTPKPVDLKPNEWTTIDTGFALEDGDYVPQFERWYLAIFPRSGISHEYGLRFDNTIPVIDMDYRKTVKLTVTVDKPCHLEAYERFAQFVIMSYGTFENEIIPEVERTGGFGSSGRL